MDLRATIASLFDRFGYLLGCIAAFLLSLKLSLGYIALIPLITLWVLREATDPRPSRSYHPGVAGSLALLMIVVAVSSAFGIDLLRSYQHLGSLFFFPLTVLVYCDLAARGGVVGLGSWLIFGQTLGALNTFGQTLFPEHVSRFVLGSIAQSGQMAMTLPMAIGLSVVLGANKILLRETLLGFFSFLLLLPLGFWRYLPRTELWFSPLVVVAFFCLFVLPFLARLHWDEYREQRAHLRLFLMTVAIPLLSIALLINLKRGPWAGVTVALLLFLGFYAKRLVIPVLGIVAAVLLLVEPVRTRILESQNHFFISGGRNAIWEIGFELATKYPLGIGFENSGVLQKFSTEIPPELKHFHNNALNVLVETGWLGLGLFIWWIFNCIRAALIVPRANPFRAFTISVGCAFVAWQLAGIVEYNFGNSAVVLIAYIGIGMTIGALAPSTRDASPSS